MNSIDRRLARLKMRLARGELEPSMTDESRASIQNYQRDLHIIDPRFEMLRAARKRARRADLEYDLELPDIVIPTHCPVLGIPLFPSQKLPGPNSPSLDRIENAKGYVRGNVVVVSYKANTMKHNATPEELRRLSDFYERRELVDLPGVFPWRDVPKIAAE